MKIDRSGKDLQYKSTKGMQDFKDPFATSGQKDPFAGRKNPFEMEGRKNPFEGTNEDKEDAVFKDSGLSLGLKTLNNKTAPPPKVNVFRVGAPSPMGNMFPHNSDNVFAKSGYMQNEYGYLQTRNPNGSDSSKYGDFNNFQKAPGQLLSPIGGGTNKKDEKYYRKFHDPSPKVEMMNNSFETPTSKGVFNHAFIDINQNKKNDPGSFGVSPRDISTTRAVFNQQTKFNEQKREYEVPTPQRNMNKEVMTPSGYAYSSSPYGYPNNYQNAFVNYGNTPTGGSFGASPAAWQFNMTSPNATAFQNYGTSPFTQFVGREAKADQASSPKFNSVSAGQKQNHFPPSGQDSSRQYNNQLASAFNKFNNVIPNYAQSPANAFSFS